MSGENFDEHDKSNMVYRMARNFIFKYSFTIKKPQLDRRRCKIVRNCLVIHEHEVDVTLDLFQS